MHKYQFVRYVNIYLLHIIIYPFFIYYLHIFQIFELLYFVFIFDSNLTSDIK